MKKLLYIMIAAALAVTACEEPFEPAADPQAYPQEDARSLPDAFTVSPVASIDLAKVTDELVSVAKLGTSPLPEDASFGPFTVVIDGTVKLAADENLKVKKAELQEAVADLFGLKPVPRTMKAVVNSSVQIEGQGFKLASNEFELIVAPEAPVFDEHYYYIGAANGWDNTDKSYELKNASGSDFYDDPVIRVTIPAPVDNDGNRIDNWFKIAPGVAYESENFWDNIFIGAAENGESAYEGKFLMAHNDVVGAFNIGPASEEAVYYNIQINLLDQTYSVKVLNFPDNLYMVGTDFGGWNWGDDGVVSLTQVLHNPDWGAEAEGQFWTIRYLTAGHGVKFNKNRDWDGGQFGALGINDGFYNDGDGNLCVEEDGIYLIHIDLKRDMLHVEPARVYGIGDCFGGWNTAMDDALFQADGKTLKATVKNTGEIRMYVESSIATSDWWTREFVFFDGKIAYRGNAGDQDRVKVLKDQTVFLDFNAGTAEVKGEGEAPTLPENMYLIGEGVGGWDWGANAVDMIPVATKAGQFWAIRYIEAGKGFKFNSKKEWGGDFHSLDTNEGYTVSDGNCYVDADGVYMVYVDVENSKVCVEPAQVFGIGDCFGGWGSDPVAFTVEGDKVIGTTTGTGEIRMYATSSIQTSDWWTREFVFFDGKIAYRGAGGDQDRVTVDAGKKVTLDFNAGTATVE
ncbi:MAG: DUF5115 domain-containing protein [Bacteroidales bacterium]|nr:DUF5115 domain-containing protein [Bacteroidales bacterium]